MGLLNKFRKLETKDLAEEVVESLSNLLTLKQTFGAWQKGLGLDDYSYGNHCEEIVKKIVEDICFNIQQYEKRFKLAKVCVVSSKNPVDLCLELEGTLEGKHQAFYINFKKNKEVSIAQKS